jgi:hypothetical protein
VSPEVLQAEAAFREGLIHARNAGRLLLEAKRQCQHGEWLPWLKGNVRRAPRTAQAYMRVAKRWSELEATAQRVAHLPLRDGLKLLAAPKEEPSADEAVSPDLDFEERRPRLDVEEWAHVWPESGTWFPAATGESVGITWEKGFRFPAEPDPEKLRASLRAEFEGTDLGEAGDWAPADLPNWMLGHLYAFLGTPGELAAGGV